MKKIFLLLSVVSCFCFTSKQLVTEKDMAAYILVYFKDDTHGLYFALSSDGYTFTDVNNGNPVIAGDTIAEQRGIRDPYIMRGVDGWFYMAMTDLHIYGKQKGYRDTEWERPKDLYDWGNNRGFVLMKSPDLLHWTHSVLDIHKAYPKLDVGCTWAPELIYDDKAGKMMIYFTMRKGKGKTKLYYAYMNKDFTAFESEPEILFDYPDSTKQILDADITKLPDGRFCMMYVVQENPGGIKMAFSDRINGDYVYRPEQVDFEPRACEAPNVWKRIGENKWVLMYDVFSVNPHNFGFAETTDFKTFTNLGHFDKGVMKRNNFSVQKHGAVIQLTKKEAERLRKYWENTGTDKYKLVWSDEFDNDGVPNPDFWNYEKGFVRNNEYQWYQPENVYCRNGILTIEARREQIVNPNFTENSADWRKNRRYAEYSSACIKTNGKKDFLYGRFEVRAKIPTASGSWPAIWTLGNSMPWPSCGEIDIMEYYRIKNVPHILANTAWGTDKPGNAKWDTQTVPFSKFTDKDPDWADKFHIWRMDWDEEAIRLYLDDELLNETQLSETQNGSIGNYSNPFHQPHYILLNLAIGGNNGGIPDDAAFPLKYEIDYVRVYQENSDRRYWTDLAYKIAAPVLENMSRGELSKNMQLELSPTWDGRDKRVSYMEAFGRLMDGIAPWLSLPDDDTPEGKQRKQLREWALKSYTQAVDPKSPDYLLWRNEGQPLVDAAFLASSFLRAPKQLWEPLDELTKKRYIEEFQQLRRVDPPYSNWLLFSATIETFLLSIDAQYDMYRIHSAIRKIEEWYVGDGWYSDGEHFAFDYYNSYAIQPMYVQVLEVLANKKHLSVDKTLEIARKRMQRFGIILERFISPEGTFPVFGRSMTYRLGVFQPLSLLVLKENLPEELPEGQVRTALTASMKRMFSIEGSFNDKGFLQLGFAGHQPNLADRYTNNGSLYLTSEVFLPLGLPAGHSFWTSPAQDWTSKKAWNGADFPKDHATKE